MLFTFGGNSAMMNFSLRGTAQADPGRQYRGEIVLQFVTPALMNEGKKRSGIFRFFRRASSQDAFYEAESLDGKTYLLWVEACRLDQLYTFPCVLRHEDTMYIFESLRKQCSRQMQKDMIQLWKQVVTPENIHSDYRVTRLLETEFDGLYASFLRRDNREDPALPQSEEEEPDDTASD